MIQLLRGVKHLHDNWILHRDLKTSNLLLSHSGILKVRIREKKRGNQDKFCAAELHRVKAVPEILCNGHRGTDGE